MASIQKRGNYWRVQIRRKGYPTLSSTFDTKAEATLWAAQQEKTLSEQTPERVVQRLRDQDYRLQDAFDRYIVEILPSKKPTTQERDKGSIRRLCRDYGDVALTKIDGQTLAAMIRQWQTTLSANSIRLYLAHLSHLYNIARKEWGMVDLINPVELVRKPKLPQGRDRRLVGDEEERLLNACMAMNPELADVVIVAIETAMRQGEILGLEWRHVHWLDHTCYLPDTKNGTARVVPLSVRAEEALLRQQQRGCTLQRATGKGGKVWRYTNDGMRASYTKAMKKAGIVGLTFHDLRHEATSRFCEKAIPMMTVQAITGHKSTQMLKRYTHISGKTLVDAVRG
ncbi:site-specific integrase [Acidithiobacillus ferrooxidans]|uniref:tyrosine-type recombinase/integrase n=1 Tax=Acidithiobacillus ferrooxidans TaxID=920 RepID=UPI001C06C350|nr:site-specific integrase [Acidithiobacillus ferrooxidans]MBU2860269.1 site-specific integrase [Acidithiobacillus ferrooxidans]